MVIGAAGELPKPPEKPIVFLEGLASSSCNQIHNLNSVFVFHSDMDDSELAEAVCHLLTSPFLFHAYPLTAC